MKKLLAVALLLLLACGIASAAENNWRFHLMADDGTGMFSAAPMTIGVHSSSLDGNYSDQAASDGQDLRFPIAVTMATVKAVEGQFLGMLWNRDVKSPRPPWTAPIYYDASYPPYYHKKVWDLRIAGLSQADTRTPTRLMFLTVSSATLPAATLGSRPLRYYLEMVDNKGKVGAPANGTIWSIPIPTAHSWATPYFTLTLPTITLSANTESTFINEGYKMEFWQEAVPEPSSMMALGVGFMALAGYARRRRA